MWRVAILVLVLAVCAGVRAEDDDTLLETPKSEGLPERLQALEREWAEDVGSKGAQDEPAEGADTDVDADAKEAHDAAAGADDAPDEPLVKPAPPEEEPSPAKRSSALRGPLQPSPRAPAAPRDPASVSAEKDTKPEPARKPLAREPTAPED